MEKDGQIEIRVSGKIGNVEITPDNFDIKEIISILQNVEDLLYSGDKKNRPIISYDIQQGSVRNIFKTGIQYIVSFNAVLGLISNTGSIDYLDIDTAKAIENLQELAIKKDFSFDITTSIDKSNIIHIDKFTEYKRTEAIWADAEFYFYGKITNAGGKDKANIHLLTDEYGTVRIQTPITFLEQQEENILYKSLGIRAKGKQHSENGDIDFTNLGFIELIDYNPIFDEDYLKNLRTKAKNSWLSKINPDEWLRQIRGNYES
ncbi:hypothetical protein [Epilithonimonas hispanica]|uniref:Uncharacterized protein n=1 Tax=Epilithonimonas hispanica TaxID=358687 RepID=A0A3D9CVV6_9FLAO|nr:hypothetical protein [Epilithonimonas hispanica]REC69916.1 hypothetical protein DRF58_11485 [Epilithonimonas hispanica]